MVAELFVRHLGKFVAQKFVKRGTRLVKLEERVREIFTEDIFTDPNIAIKHLELHLREQRQSKAHVKELKYFRKSGISAGLVNDCVASDVSEVSGGNELEFFRANAELSAVVEHPNVFHVESSYDKRGIRRVHGGCKKVVNINGGWENANKRVG